MRRQRNIELLVGIQQQQQQHSGNKCEILGLSFLFSFFLNKWNRTWRTSVWFLSKGFHEDSLLVLVWWNLICPLWGPGGSWLDLYHPKGRQHGHLWGRGQTQIERYMLKVLGFLTIFLVPRCFNVTEKNLREQVEPLLFGDGLLPQQLQHDGPHQVPFVLKL